MSPTSPDVLADQLEAGSVPVTRDPCRTCSDPCEDHTEFPPRLDVDMSSDLLGSFKPYGRQVVISTGKSDWPREVTEAPGELATYLKDANDALLKTAETPFGNGKAKPSIAGVFHTNDSTRLSITNGSHCSKSEDSSKQTVLVLPDYKFVTDVPRSEEGAAEFWKAYLDPSLNRAGRGGTQELKSYPLPYSCVILLCSHKRRDNRCHLAAPILQEALCSALSSHGYEVDTQLQDPEVIGDPLEEVTGTDAEREEEFLKRLRAIESDDPKRALILKISHIGGHKYAGNVIVYTPHGSGVWYGRVSAHEVPTLVKATIIEGKVLPRLLRGGINITRPSGRHLHDW